MTDRPRIPAAIQRELRQRCGFGCAMCGSPVYEYEHIDGYKITGHDPEKMTLLCREHHGEKTAGRLPVRLVRQAAANPYNGERSFTKKHELYFDEETPLMMCLGNVAFEVPARSSRTTGVMVDGEYALGGSFRGGHVKLNLDMRDMDNHVLLRILDGHLRLATSAWDVTFVARRLVIRSGAGEVAADILLDPSNGRLDVQAASFTTNHVRLRIGRHAAQGGFEIVDQGSVFSGVGFRHGGIAVGSYPDFDPTMTFAKARYAYGAPPAPYGSAFVRTRK